MSLFSKVEGEVKTIAHDVEAAFVKLFQEEPKIEQAASATISVVAPLIVAVVAATGQEPEAVAIAGIVAVVQSDLAAVQVTLNQAGAGTANVTASTLLKAINSNLASLLTAGMIKNPTTLASVTKDVTSISAALAVLIAAL